MITLVIIAVTCLVSILCFSGTLNIDRLKFNAYEVWHRKKWHQMLTYGLVHGGWGHLLFNMLTLYFFGTVGRAVFRRSLRDRDRRVPLRSPLCQRHHRIDNRGSHQVQG